MSDVDDMTEEFARIRKDSVQRDGAGRGNVSETVCTGYNAEATLTLSFSLDSLDEELRAEKVLVAGHLYWFMHVSRNTQKGHNELSAKVWAEDMKKYPMKYEVTYTLEANDRNDRIDHHTTCAYDSPIFEYRQPMINWDILWNTRCLYEVDGKLTVTAKINVRLPMCCNFSNANLQTDVKVIVDAAWFPLNKTILAFHSPFFKAMFFGQFKEANQNVIQLSEVNRVAFVNLLNVLFVRSFKLKMVHAAAVLELADRFGIVAVVDHCEEILLECDSLWSHPSLAERLVFATRFSLNRLQKRCLEMCDSAKIIKQVTASPFYNELSNDVARMLLDRIVEVLK